jgi:hypothetical protein
MSAATDGIRPGLPRYVSFLDGDAPGSEPRKVRAFQIILSLTICAEYWVKALNAWHELFPIEFAALAAATLLATVVVQGRWRRAGLAGFALLQLGYVWAHFPHTGNHRYLELVFAALLAFLRDDDDDEVRLTLRSLRWMVVVVLFFSGVQKLVHGYYFRGQFLAHSMWRDWFRTALGPLLPAEELERLTSYVVAVGDGPYLVSSPGFVAISNAVWILEIALAVLLIPRVTRGVAWIAVCLFVVATEAVAREFMFGVEFVAAITLFARGDATRRLVVPAAVVLGVFVLMRLGVLPEVLFN